MNPSQALKSWLAGKQPSSQREASALLDESRSLLVSKLPTTAMHISNLTTGDIDAVLAGGKKDILKRSHAIHLGNQTFVRPSAQTAAPRPAAFIPRATATAAKPAPAAPKLTTAAEFQPKPLLMNRAEFNKLSAVNKMLFVKTGGKLQ